MTFTGMAGAEIGTGEDSGSVGGFEDFGNRTVELKGELVESRGFGKGELYPRKRGEGFCGGLAASPEFAEEFAESLISTFEERSSY
jgi:hypothetical protein